jgi:phosphoribosyl-ATP pyrophosphohydrolase
LIPSIDMSRGRAVQLIGGEEEVLDAGDPIAVLERFSMVGEVAVVDIDAARGDGDNQKIIETMCKRARIRVGGGIRDLSTAIRWLDAGAEQVVIGTAAEADLLEKLPRDRVIVALDTRAGRLLTHGWRRETSGTVEERIAALAPHCSGFLVTFVELEGRMRGTDLSRAERYIRQAAPARVTVAGGITTADEVAALDRMGADAQVGMALYTGDLLLADSVAALLRSDRDDGLWPTVVVDEHGTALGLAWSDRDSLIAAMRARRGIYRSRNRGQWVKGTTSGATQELIGVAVDCDRDTLRFTVCQEEPGFCHTGTRTCWGDDSGVERLARRIRLLARSPSPGSNTARLLADPLLLASKIEEEASELAAATGAAATTTEAADLIYFALVKAISEGCGLAEIESALDARERRVTRRPMAAK